VKQRLLTHGFEAEMAASDRLRSNAITDDIFSRQTKEIIVGGSKRTWTDEQLIEAVRINCTYSDIARNLNLKVTPGNFKTIKKYISKLDLNTDHFLGQSWVSDKNKQNLLRKPIEEILVENSTYNTSHLYKRLIDAELKIHQCESCWNIDWLGLPIAIEVDHINGINNDHRLENLRFLCPNCHSQTKTWRGRNKVS